MKRYETETAEIGIDKVMNLMRRDDIVEIHLMDILFGLTIFRDKRLGKICIASHNSIDCFNSIEEAISFLEKNHGDRLRKPLKAKIIRIAG